MGDAIEARLQQYGPILVRTFVKHGLPGVWGVAIARHESAFIPSAANLVGKDGDRGGAWGLCQVTLRTARDLDPNITHQDLLVPGTNADIAARICAEANGRRPGSLVDVLARYNSGVPYAQCPKKTRETYIPRVLRFVSQYAGYAERIEKELAAEPPTSA